MRTGSTQLSRVSALALAAVVAVPAMALDTVVLTAPGADRALQSKLENSSLLIRNLEEQQAAIRSAQRKWYMPWRRPGPPPEPLSTTDVLASARAEYRRMISVLYGEGYYSGVVKVKIDGREAADIPPLDPPATINNVEIIVQPGPEFKFSEAQVKPLAPETDLPDGYQVGEIARSGVIGDAARSATDAWRNAGHAKADLAKEQITADHATARIASDLTLAPGPKLRFGPMIVRGNKRVRTERIVAIAGLPTGEVYSPEEINDAGERLRRSGAFRSVSIREADAIGPGDQIGIETEVLEEKRRRLGIGVELSTQEGARFNAYWMHRNLLGGAENLRFDLDIENIGTTEPDNGTDYIFSTVLRRPATFRTDIDAFLAGTVEYIQDPGYTASTVEVGGGLTYYPTHDLTFSAGLGVRGSDVEDAFGHRRYLMITLPLTGEWDRRDDEFDPTGGFYLDGLLNPFYGSQDVSSGAQIEIDARTYYGLGEEKRTVLAGRLQYGSLVGPEIPNAPPDYLFYAGGGGSVRGQPFQSLGVGEVNGTIVGGRSYVALSGELRSYVWNNIGLVGFYDAGYVGESEFYDGEGNWMSGAGIGFRYKTGFGPIRVDVATPVEGGPSDADKVQLYIGIGQAF